MRLETVELPHLLLSFVLGLAEWCSYSRLIEAQEGAFRDYDDLARALGDDYDLEYYEDGYPKLPACLDRRRKAEPLAEAA